MFGDRIVLGMRMKDDNVLILDGFGVGRCMHGCFVVGFVEVFASGIGYVFGDKESGNIGKESRESDERNYFDHDESSQKKNKITELGCCRC